MGLLRGPNLGHIAQYSGKFRLRRQQFQGAYGASRHKRCAGGSGGSWFRRRAARTRCRGPSSPGPRSISCRRASPAAGRAGHTILHSRVYRSRAGSGVAAAKGGGSGAASPGLQVRAAARRRLHAENEGSNNHPVHKTQNLKTTEPAAMHYYILHSFVAVCNPQNLGGSE